MQWVFDVDTVTDDIALSAHWTINSYNVTFDPQGGTPVAGIPADFNSMIAAPQAPTMQNYTFGGWYKEADTRSLNGACHLQQLQETLPLSPTIR